MHFEVESTKSLGIVTETPGLHLDPPVMRYMVISINDGFPIAAQNQQTFRIRPGDTVTISHIEANYERGLSADIIGAGTMNDFRKKIQVHTPTRIVVRKDYIDFGTIYLEIGGSRSPIAGGAASPRLFDKGSPFLLFRVKINGQEHFFRSKGYVRMIKGDLFELVDVVSGHADSKHLVVNFKGFVGNREINTGEDRGYQIDTGSDLWPRYSVNKKGEMYRVIVSEGKRIIGQLFVQLETPMLRYVILGQGNGPKLCVTPDDEAVVDPGRPIRMLDIHTNVSDNLGVRAFLKGPGHVSRSISVDEPFILKTGADTAPGSGKTFQITILRGRMSLGTIPLIFGQSLGGAVPEGDVADRDKIFLEKKSGKKG